MLGVLHQGVESFNKFKCAEIFYSTTAFFNVSCCICGSKMHLDQYASHFQVQHLSLVEECIRLEDMQMQPKILLANESSILELNPIVIKAPTNDPKKQDKMLEFLEQQHSVPVEITFNAPKTRVDEGVCEEDRILESNTYERQLIYSDGDSDGANETNVKELNPIVREVSTNDALNRGNMSERLEKPHSVPVDIPINAHKPKVDEEYISKQELLNESNADEGRSLRSSNKKNKVLKKQKIRHPISKLTDNNSLAFTSNCDLNESTNLKENTVKNEDDISKQDLQTESNVDEGRSLRSTNKNNKVKKDKIRHPISALNDISLAFTSNCDQNESNSIKENGDLNRGVDEPCAVDAVSNSNVALDPKVSHSERPGKYNKFGRSIFSMHNLNQHTAGRKQATRFKCDVCGGMFKTKHALELHKKIHSKGRTVRKTCGENFTRQVSLKKHLRNNNVNAAAIICNICGKTFTQTEIMLRHKEEHTGIKDFKCEECRKAFFTSRELKFHMKRHLALKSIVCAVCGKHCRNGTALTEHMRLHTSVYPTQCNLCGKGFFSLSALNQHSVVHNVVRPFKCDICGATFSRKQTLLNHEFTHSKDRKYACKTCGKHFTQSSSFKRHLLTHNGVRGVLCDICGMKFTRTESMIGHKKRQHTANRNFKCKVCNKNFFTSAKLKSHMNCHASVMTII